MADDDQDPEEELDDELDDDAADEPADDDGGDDEDDDAEETDDGDDEDEASEPDEAPESGDDRDPDAHAETLREWFSGRPLSARAHLTLGLVAPAVMAAVNMARVASFTIDDAYISYRYARNLADGLGLVYNAGERIEGYTNFSFTLLLALCIKLGIDPDIAAKVMGGAAGIGVVALVYFISQRVMKFTLAPAIATWLVASATSFVGYSVFGLETSTFAFFVMAGVYRFMIEEERDEGLPWSGLCFAAAGITRPEAPLYLGVMMLFLGGRPLVSLHRLFGRDEEEGDAAMMMLGGFSLLIGGAAVKLLTKRPSAISNGFGWVLLAMGVVLILMHIPRKLFSKRNISRGLLFVGPVALHVMWRHSYYGKWVPNTLGAKTGNIQQQLAGGMGYVHAFIDQTGPVIYLALLGVAAGIVWRQRALLAFACLSLLGCTYVSLVGGDWMPLHRFMAPFQPFIFLLVGVGARYVIERRSRVANYAILLFALVTSAHRGHRLRVDRARVLKKEKRFWDMAAGGVATWFAMQEKELGRESVKGKIAMGDIGEIGYKTNYPVLDLLGLVDPVIAELPGGYTLKIGIGYRNRFFDQKPRYFIMISSDNDCYHPSVPGSRALFHDGRFLRQYDVSGRVKLDAGFSWCVYERLDSGGKNKLLELSPRGKPRINPAIRRSRGGAANRKANPRNKLPNNRKPKAKTVRQMR